MVATSRPAAIAAPFRALGHSRPPGTERHGGRPPPEDVMTRYTPRRPQAAPRWFVAAWLTATALATAASALAGAAWGTVH